MKRPCFTLIELLVVIATLTLLIAILLPSLRNSRQHAEAILCGSNIKQLVLGLIMYETENDTFPYAFDESPLNPPVGGYAGNSAYDRMGWWWFNYISDYHRKNKDRKASLWCPSRRIRELKFNYVLHGNYGVNQSVCKSSRGRKSHAEFIGTPLRRSDIPHSGRTLLILDSGYSLISWWHVTDVPPIPLGGTIEDAAYVPGLEINKKKDLWPGQHQDAIYGRHPSKSVNVGFADGHISRKKADDLFVEKIAEGYKNKSPLWQPK
jgi:prepilin-type processing-associated H-X9-DG protein